MGYMEYDPIEALKQAFVCQFDDHYKNDESPAQKIQGM